MRNLLRRVLLGIGAVVLLCAEQAFPAVPPMKVAEISLAPAAPPATAEAASENAPKPGSLDLRDYHLTFEDNFDALSISANGNDGRWFAALHTTFGLAKFVPQSAAGPFSIQGGLLTIRAEKKDTGWQSGILQSVDAKGRGFAQQYGYFEIRAKVPAGAATWPGFWLLSQNGYLDPKATRGEIDVLEAYGDQPDVVHTSVHLWPSDGHHWTVSRQFKVPGMSDDFHRYGVSIDPTWVVFYADGSEIYRFPTLDQYRTPFYVLISLAMGNVKSIAKAQSPSDMVVDYVRVYAKDDQIK